ncbi:ATP/GTP-binding protein [Flammeovirga pectinis]|uniref:ATP/GTP-binding protein n=1 Tax=Flammeovirga pectinis TaxID=2494373 RepID=A0A3Q9FKE0_9BACT|nr:AAA family ATPase [Flammeovirga pectinis]AZQ61726.1 ATP/GTP-binding protein [Flammeovirga pectinis]
MDKRIELKKEFLKEWPISRLEKLKLEEYTNLDKNSFCYWLEAITSEVGSIWGGSSYKFGIFKRNNKENEVEGHRKTDGEYSWLGKYGKTKEEAFLKLKSLVLQISKSAINNDLEEIEKIDLGNAYKWKIAHLYSNFNVFNFFKEDAIKFILKEKGYKGVFSYANAYMFLKTLNTENEEFYTFSQKLWNLYEKEPEANVSLNLSKGNKRNDLNQILYGPPGTGKTYNTINKALEIIEGNELSEEDRNNGSAKKKFNEYVESGQVVFTTFHQSMSYEDFVEGIKPKTNDDDQIYYETEDGIFKKICSSAKKIEVIESSDIDFDKVDYYKMSIGGKNRKIMHDWNINNETVSLGYGGSSSLKEFEGIDDWRSFNKAFTEKNPERIEESKFHSNAAFRFLKMKIGDIVIITLGNLIIDAIGVIVGDYFYDDTTEIDHVHYRKVKWLATDLGVEPSKFINKKISQQTIYEFYREDIKIDTFKDTFSKKEKVQPKNHVLIIDEINRGNVSAIFGEQITLLEESKRLGNKEELKVKLPYSKEPFGVPNNLHIIGTMNTADRSVEALDTALRRRFVFKEMMPKPDLLEYKEGIGINLQLVLETINERIKVLLDRDHQIGHSYFLKVNTFEEVKKAFATEIIPLLQEYFYGDYIKIALIIGLGFFEEPKTIRPNLFAKIQGAEGFDYTNQTTYELLDPFQMSDDDFSKAIELLLEK